MLTGDTFTLHRRTDGTVHLSGIDDSTNKARIVKETKKALIVYLPGRNYWSGRGAQAYASPELRVFHKLGDWFQGHTISVGFVVELELKKGWAKS